MYIMSRPVYQVIGEYEKVYRWHVISYKGAIRLCGIEGPVRTGPDLLLISVPTCVLQWHSQREECARNSSSARPGERTAIARVLALQTGSEQAAKGDNLAFLYR